MSIDELKALEAKATLGPWENSAGFVRAQVPVTGTLGNDVQVTLSCTWVAETTRGEGYVPGNGNADFIAALRNNCAALIACAEALKELSNMYASTWDRVDGALMIMDSGVDRFEAAHDKAREALRALEQK